jgi:hypothetical protein
MPSGGVGYYEGPDIVDRLLHALGEAALDPDALDIDDLTGLDEFHALGRAATVALADLADVRPQDRVLDIGAGIGGPARLPGGSPSRTRDRPGRDPALLPSGRAPDPRRRAGRPGDRRLRRRARCRSRMPRSTSDGAKR